MKKTVKSLRVWLLKRKLRAAYIQYMTCNSYLDCGDALAAHLNSNASRARDKCNAILEKLAVLDPDKCPVSRIN